METAIFISYYSSRRSSVSLDVILMHTVSYGTVLAITQEEYMVS
jgi:hypothetical protein